MSWFIWFIAIVVIILVITMVALVAVFVSLSRDLKRLGDNTADLKYRIDRTQQFVQLALSSLAFVKSFSGMVRKNKGVKNVRKK